MILSNLSTILGKKKLKISDLIKNTGISRPTLTALYYNHGKGINFDTLDTLCNYLNLNPGDLLSFYNIDINDIHIPYTSCTEDSIISSEYYETKTIISSATFQGYIAFKQKHLGKINIAGHLNSIDGLNYSANIYLQCQRDFYLNIGPDDVLDYITDSLCEYFIDNFPSNEIENIQNIVFFYEDEYNELIKTIQ